MSQNGRRRRKKNQNRDCQSHGERTYVRLSRLNLKGRFPVCVSTLACPVKYTASGKIAVECRAFDEPGDPSNVAVEIVVSDTGCGMTSEKLESIFREFEQVEAPPPTVHSPSDKAKGLGEHMRLSQYSTQLTNVPQV